MKTKILILGGTTESRQLASALDERFGDNAQIISSLAGRTKNIAPIAGEVRVGGFGGEEGLASYLKSENINLVIDATHPFAEQISNNAAVAANKIGVPRVLLQRPSWQLPENCDALFVPDMAEAANIVARTARKVFLTIGVNELSAFEGTPKVHFVVRMIEKLRIQPGLNDFEIIYARPPFELADEKKLMRDHDIDALVTKASGGAATFAKIEAATSIGARIILIRRPPPPDGDIVSNIDDAIKWIEKSINQF
ncbi:MAG: cobalt-precorrin-6A reductase [Rhodospirillaceae bacterium]|nr:cobalt-precorrin-6A reductase [Rhodospirillaceae bacterium]